MTGLPTWNRTIARRDEAGKFRKVADMGRHSTRQPRTRQLIETALVNELRQCHTEWARASHDERSAARERFMVAMHRFNIVAFYNEPQETLQ
jgi:hypothetical protein